MKRFLIPLLFLGNLVANRGSLFYSQERVGQNGVIFKIFKLRSMVVNAESNGAVWAVKNDKRITAFGKFLRNTRLDEVPQFYNICVAIFLCNFINSKVPKTFFNFFLLSQTLHDIDMRQRYDYRVQLYKTTVE